MPFISVTRLRIRSVRFLPSFAAHFLRTLRQVKRSPGFLGGAILADRGWTFWTLTSWDTPSAMRTYIMAEAHRGAMPHLLNWCDEAAVVHWEQAEDDLPSWAEAHRRLRADGRPSKVRWPTPEHASLDYPAPRLAGAALIRGPKLQ